MQSIHNFVRRHHILGSIITVAAFWLVMIFAGISLARQMSGLEPVDFTRLTAIGALGYHVAQATGDFQPMNANFGLIDAYEKRIRNKQERYGAIAARSLNFIEALRSNPLACDFYPEED